MNIEKNKLVESLKDEIKNFKTYAYGMVKDMSIDTLTRVLEKINSGEFDCEVGKGEWISVESGVKPSPKQNVALWLKNDTFTQGTYITNSDYSFIYSVGFIHKNSITHWKQITKPNQTVSST